MNKARIFYTIDCWRTEAEDVLADKLKYLSERKDELNSKCPQPPYLAYLWAKRGIKAGEGSYAVDKPNDPRG